MTPEQLDELEMLSKAATPGPWESTADRSDPRGERSDWIISAFERVVIRSSRPWYWNDPPRTDEADHALIAALRNSADSLIADARRLQRIEAAARKMLDDLDNATEADEWSTSELREALDCGAGVE